MLTQLISRMETASQNLEFEEAARIRDQIQAVRRVTEKQFLYLPWIKGNPLLQYTGRVNFPEKYRGESNVWYKTSYILLLFCLRYDI